ncbi:sodium-dependent phosphate transport protein 2B-like [Haemaphysalis longicornis]
MAVRTTGWLPLFIAQRLGETGARYRWFVLFYLLLTFVLIPLAALLLSLLGDLPFSIITMSIVLSLVLLTIVNVIQERCPGALPVFLQNWDFLPEWMHSLQPMDRFFTRYLDHVPFCQMFLNEMSFVSYGNVDNAPVPPPVADTT